MLTRALPHRIWTSRRVSVGIHGSPGSTSSLPAWWTAEDWTDEVRSTVRRYRDVCRAHHVEADTVLAVARGMAAYASFRTGRDCRPTNERLVLEVQVSLSTVQRARRVLKALGFVVELVAGRSVLTRDERLAAHRRGSSHRRLAAEFALCSRRNRPTCSPPLRRRPQRRRLLVERDTPPGSPVGREGSSVRTAHLRAKTETRKAPPGPAPARRVGPARRPRVDPRTRRLVAAVQRRMRWLAAVPAARLTPLLTRYATADWTARDVERAAADSAAARGWRLLPQPDHPPAYLATLLREVDVEDRPGALDEHIAATEAAQRRYERQLVIGTPCAHGRPAGDVPSPLQQHRACPLCRAAAETAAVSWP